MAKFNKKKEGVLPTTVNKMGEKAYTLSAKDELVSTLLTTFLSDGYYEKQKDIVNRILKAADSCDPLFVAKAAIYARKHANMRSVSHLLAGSLAKRLSGTDWARFFYKEIIARPDDMAEILACYESMNGGKLKIPNAMKKGFAARLETLDPYTIDKYKMERRSITLVDLVNLVHPTPQEKNGEAYRRLIKGESLADLYDSKVLDKELTKAGQSDDYSAEDAIRSVLFGEKGMPIFALLRNLRNIVEKAPSCVDEACRQLTIKEKVLHSKILPFRFATAYTEIDAMSETAQTVKFEKDRSNKTKVLAALETALRYSIENIPKLEGNTAILIDHSGSVRDGGGASAISAFSKTTGAMIGNLSATMFAYSQDNVYIGLFGDRLVDVEIDRNMDPLAFNSQSYAAGAKCGPTSENGLYIFLHDCVEQKIKVDNLIIFSDMVIGSGAAGGWDKSSYAPKKLGTFQTLFKKFRAVNPNCHTVAVDIKQTKGTSVFDASLNITNVSGWSDKIFELIARKSRGYAELIGEIERINIVGQ